jgi:phosphoribosylanthranilate isomerase
MREKPQQHLLLNYNKVMKLKICGMKYPENIAEVSALLPDYLGFIFWEKSSRFFDGVIPVIPETIAKAGVFVDADVEEIISKTEKYDLQLLQLHGKETPGFCLNLKQTIQEHNYNIQIIKAFSIDNTFDFNQLKAYEAACDYFLFDTKGKLPGGNGITFNWDVLEKYKNTKPYFLSGGIGLDAIEKIKAFQKTTASSYCVAIDVNSSFETAPGQKDTIQLQQFKKLLYENQL